MHKVTDAQIDFILEDLRSQGVVLEDLQYNLLDHVCCIVENEMKEGQDFNAFYKQTLRRFYKKELREIQEETEHLLTFKHYYAMKNTLKISGIASALLILIGSVLKVSHLPGASVSLVTGLGLFCMLFLPLMIILKMKDQVQGKQKIVAALGLTIGIITSFGIMFKLMHWPYANVLMRGSVIGFLIAFIPSYFLTRFREPELKFNTLMTSVLMLAGGGMLFALTSQGNSNNVKDGLYSINHFLNQSTREVTQNNLKLYSSLRETGQLAEFHNVSAELHAHIENIKINLIAMSEGISLEKARNKVPAELSNPYDQNVVEKYFVASTGEYSHQSLLVAIDEYNAHVSPDFMDMEFKALDISELQLENTLLSILLHELTQIQLNVATADHGYLNFAYGSVK